MDHPCLSFRLDAIVMLVISTINGRSHLLQHNSSNMNKIKQNQSYERLIVKRKNVFFFYFSSSLFLFSFFFSFSDWLP